MMNQQQQQKQPQHQQHPQQAQQLDQSSNFGANAAMQPFMATQQQPFHDAVHGQQPMGHGPYPGRMNPQAELQHMQQQLQHLYTLPPNPQTQQQISELQSQFSPSLVSENGKFRSIQDWQITRERLSQKIQTGRPE